MTEQSNDHHKEKFRPQGDPAIERQVEAALADVSLDQLYGFDKPQPADQPAPTGATLRGTHKGRVTNIRKDDVFVDLGDKNQGVAPLVQFEQVRIGEEMEFVVERYDEREGLYILGRKGAVMQTVNWDTLEAGQIVEAAVTGMNKGGLELTVKNMRAFMPAGQVDLYFHKDISVFIGERMTVEVTRFDRDKKNLIVSRRTILEREKEEAKEKLLVDLAEGQVRRGLVRSIMDFGAFVDLGGVDGLIHISELSHRRVRHPSEILNLNDAVDVKILKIDKETGKVSLSLKAAMADPWADAAARYAPGSTPTARVARVESFGAFLSVEDGVEGLLPVSEMSYRRLRHPSEVVKEGDTLKVVVLNIDPVTRKLTFSLKQAGPDPWTAALEKYTVNSVVDGKVTRTVDFGAFIELEPGIEGLCHISELSPQRVRAVADVVKPGQDVKCRVLEVEKEKHRISLSIRRAAEPVAPPPSAMLAAPVEPAKPDPKKKKRPELRGGLDSGGFFRG